MRHYNRPISVLYFILTLMVLGISWFVRDEMATFEERTFSMREGYLNEIAQIISGTVCFTADRGRLDATALAKGFQRFERQDYSSFFDTSIKGNDALRVVITDETGIVLYDSSGQPIGESIANKAEVKAALAGRYERRDVVDKDGYVTTNIAHPISIDAKSIGVVVASKSNRRLEPLVTEAKHGFIAVGIALGGIVLIIGFGLFLYFLRPIQLWFQYAQKFKNQKHPARPQLRRTSFGRLGAAIDHLYDSLSDRGYMENLAKKFVHELKDPITNIRTAGEFLEGDLSTEKRTILARDIVIQADRMHDLIMRMLAFAALEKRDCLKELESYSIKDLFNLLLAEIHLRLESSDIKVVLNIPDDINIYCDPLLVRYAISNLIINGAEHSPRGSSIEVDVVRMGDQVEVRVRDHGSGIPDYALDRIFEPFFTLPKRNAKIVGTGLGLPYVREVADLHYGGIALTNHAGGGVLAVLSLSA